MKKLTLSTPHIAFCITHAQDASKNHPFHFADGTLYTYERTFNKHHSYLLSGVSFGRKWR